jgi:hypothetical protein
VPAVRESVLLIKSGFHPAHTVDRSIAGPALAQLMSSVVISNMAVNLNTIRSPFFCGFNRLVAGLLMPGFSAGFAACPFCGPKGEKSRANRHQGPPDP